MSNEVAQLEDQLAVHIGMFATLEADLEKARGRVAKLEAATGMLKAALKDCRRYAEDHDDEWVPHRVDDGLAEADAVLKDDNGEGR